MTLGQTRKWLVTMRRAADARVYNAVPIGAQNAAITAP